MKIRVRASRRRFSRIMLNLPSMIDIVFLLLIYFMVTIVIAKPEDRLNPKLQTRRDPAAASASDFQPQIVEAMLIDRRPSYRLGMQVYLDKASLLAALEPLNKDAGLFIRVGNDVPAGFAIAAFQAGHDAGFVQVTYVLPDE